MNTVATSTLYSVAVDVGKNRIFLNNRGSWTDAKEVSGWLDDIAAAIKLCKPGFTVLIDWTQSTGILLTDWVGEAQKVLMQGGMHRAARLYEKETFLKHQMDRISEKTGFLVKSFFDVTEAEAWLDQT